MAISNPRAPAANTTVRQNFRPNAVRNPTQPTSNSLSSGVANTGTGALKEDQVSYKGGFLGLEDKGMTKYNVDDAAWANQSGGVQKGIDARYQNVTAGPGGQARFSDGAQAANVAADPQAREQQQQLARMLFDQANGNGPSAAQSQLMAGNSAAINAQMAMARSSGNPNAMRQAQFNAAALTQQNANAAAGLRANEMLAGRQLLDTTLGGIRNQDLGQRGQDIGQNQYNASAAQQNEQYNSTLDMQNRQFVEDASQKYLAMGMTLAEASRQAQIDLQKTKLGAASGGEQTRMGADMKGSDAINGFTNNLVQTVGGAAAKIATGGK